MSLLSRRRFLRIAAATTSLSAAGLAQAPFAQGAEPRALYRWRGKALGGTAEVLLSGHSKGAAESVGQQIVAEVARLEDLFSLYKPDSALSRLNREGVLDKPAPEFLELLALSSDIARKTDGAFDITVQPLWELHFAAAKAGLPPSTRLKQLVRRLVDYRKVHWSESRIAFEQPGMAITLNGIAQGYITDRVTALLEAAGYHDTLVDMGEIRALGLHPSGRSWQIGVNAPKEAGVPENPDPQLFRLKLADGQAAATSAAVGTRFSDGTAHLLNPVDGESAPLYRSLTVTAPSAALADGLSTGLSLLPPEKARAITGSLPSIGLHAVTAAGRVVEA